MDLVQLSLPGEIVKKNNELVRSRINVTKIEHSRIIATLIACIHHDDVEFRDTYRLPVKKFLSDVSGRGYGQLKQTCKELAKCFVEIEDRKAGRDKNGLYPFQIMPFFSFIGYKKGFIEATFNPKMRPLLLELKKCFTQYNLIEYLRLPSIYSQKIFELLKSWSNVPEFTVNISELHHLLNIPPAFRKDFRQVRIYVLQQAEKDINKKTELFFYWEAIKQGRSVVAVKFIFGRKKDREEQIRKQEQEKQSKQTNKYALLAIKCFKEKKEEGKMTDLQCHDERPSTKKCSICKKIYSLKK